jgi:hypothetical protein
MPELKATSGLLSLIEDRTKETGGILLPFALCSYRSGVKASVESEKAFSRVGHSRLCAPLEFAVGPVRGPELVIVEGIEAGCMVQGRGASSGGRT